MISSRTFEFVAIMLVALSMAMAFCHLLEMSARLAYAPLLWIEVTNVESTYRLIGPPIGPPIGAAIEGAAWISAAVLAVIYWRRSPNGRRLALIAAVLMLAAQLLALAMIVHSALRRIPER